MATDDNTVSTGELGRRLETLTSTLTTGLETLAEKVDARPTWADVARVERGLEAKLAAQDAASKAKDVSQDVAISKLEGWGSWGTKIAGGMVMAAVLGGAMVKPGGL